MPKNHELAQNRLREMADGSAQLNEITCKKGQQTDKIEDTAFPLPRPKPDLQVNTNPKPIQKSLANFVISEDEVPGTPIEKMQGDINRILVMLQSLTIPEKKNDLKENMELILMLEQLSQLQTYWRLNTLASVLKFLTMVVKLHATHVNNFICLVQRRCKYLLIS
ncbi:Hypothetical predicted protein [Paramuricea clavata]|uniref:Uncharacterized protein n=1 Tax=Paramuricea clavata TaxID=317549 RepID=A0A7D9J6P5_PARCT|nr:Hypothetical predicted protein [Paramuricea clavata]